MTRAWELRVDERWRTRVSLGFGLSGLVLNSLLLWFTHATLSARPFADLPPWQRPLAWGAGSTSSGPWSSALARLAGDPIETLYASFVLATVIGMVYATLRGRFDPEPEVETARPRTHRIVLQVVGFVLPFLPLVALAWYLFRLLSAASR